MIFIKGVGEESMFFFLMFIFERERGRGRETERERGRREGKSERGTEDPKWALHG